MITVHELIPIPFRSKIAGDIDDMRRGQDINIFNYQHFDIGWVYDSKLIQPKERKGWWELFIPKAFEGKNVYIDDLFLHPELVNENLLWPFSYETNDFFNPYGKADVVIFEITDNTLTLDNFRYYEPTTTWLVLNQSFFTGKDLELIQATFPSDSYLLIK